MTTTQAETETETPSGITRLFLHNLKGRCDEQCSAIQCAIDAMQEANYYPSRARMIEHLARITPGDLCDALMVAWPRVDLKRATGRDRDQWLDLLNAEYRRQKCDAVAEVTL